MYYNKITSKQDRERKRKYENLSKSRTKRVANIANAILTLKDFPTRVGNNFVQKAK